MKRLLPEKNPTDLQESLQIFESIKYRSSGAPMVFLDYQYSFKYWSMSFRNPVSFSDPNIKGKTPIDAVHKMLDFLRTVQKKKN